MVEKNEDGKVIDIQYHGIVTYRWLMFMVNVGKYASPMDPVGMDWYVLEKTYEAKAKQGVCVFHWSFVLQLKTCVFCKWMSKFKWLLETLLPQSRKSIQIDAKIAHQTAEERVQEIIKQVTESDTFKADRGPSVFCSDP